MTTQADYTLQEWEQLEDLPLLVVAGVMTASGSGTIGKIKEGLSVLPSIRESAKQFPGNALIQNLILEYNLKGELHRANVPIFASNFSGCSSLVSLITPMPNSPLSLS